MCVERPALCRYGFSGLTTEILERFLEDSLGLDLIDGFVAAEKAAEMTCDGLGHQLGDVKMQVSGRKRANDNPMGTPG